MILNGHHLKATTLRDVIRQQGALGDKPAVVLGEDSISFADLSAAANRVGNVLKALGIGKGDVVASYMYNSIDHVCLWFGCAKIGAIWAPLNIALIKFDLAFTIEESGARMVVVDSELLDNYLEIRDQVARPDRIEVLRGTNQAAPGWKPFEELLAGDPEEPEAEVCWSDPAGLIFTGGSTGMPKAVLVSNGWYFPGVCRYYEMFTPTSEDVHLSVGQMYHTIGSAVDVFSPFYFGITTVLMRWFSASRLLDVARANNCTVSVLIGAAMLALLARPERPDDADNPLRLLAGGTGAIPRDTVEAFKKRFNVDRLEIYGQTETGPLGCFSQRTHDRPYHSVGTANGWADVMIGDEGGFACAPGVTGEILLRPRFPSTFMLGYYNRPEKVVESWRDLWFHTGDLGHLDENGYLHFDGRMAHVIRRRGESIAAMEVEKIILAHPDVIRCGVVGVPNDLGDEDVKACVELQPDSTLSPLEIVKWCEERVAYFKVPRYVEIAAELPLSASKGDVERYKLKERSLEAAWDREAAGYKVARRA